jgi:hypothetical protein
MPESYGGAMSTTALVIVLVVVVVVVLVAAVFVGWSVTRRRSLREQFGDEYEDVLDSAGSRRLAETELRQRQRRHQNLNIVALSPEAQQSYTAAWQAIQEQFVDDPAASVAQADTLVTTVAAERGYPTDDYDQHVSDLSVQHAGALSGYRSAHDISVNGAAATASTEDLRQALVNYRALVTDLIGAPSVDAEPVVANAPVDTAPVDTAPVDTAAVETPGDDTPVADNTAVATADDDVVTPSADASDGSDRTESPSDAVPTTAART